MKMNDGNNICINKLISDNYSYWKLCMEVVLQGQDLWDLISSDDLIPEDTLENAEVRRKLKVKCEILELDKEKPVSDACLRHYLICGL
ncbi:unnamed protein product [Citrullus colocynthis]|uniref:DUF4219 domain-containing protein n=1 Tax=Citrullus colocynthis TaxID=252529 RepID=A0ABP0YC15_9ROSI